MQQSTRFQCVERRIVSIAILIGSAALAACQGHGLGAVPGTAPQTLAAAPSAGGVPTGRAAGRAAMVDWPQYRFNADRTGFNPRENTLDASNVPHLQLLWSAQLGELVNYSSPAVVNGTVYIASTDGRLWAYPANGCGASLCTQPTWVSASFGQMMDSPTVANGFVYIGSQTSFSSNDGKLDVFSASGCAKAACPPLWQGLAGDDAILQSSPAVAKGRVYIGSHDGTMYVFDANGCGSSTCMPLWTAQTGGSIESTATIDGTTVYIGSDDGNLYAFKARGCGKPACKPLWTGQLGDAVFESSPAVVGNRVYIGSQHAVAAFNANGCGSKTCQPLWRGTNGNDFFNGSPAIAKGHLYIGDEDGVAVFKTKGCGSATCTPLWLDFGVGFQAAVASSPTVANGVVYAGRNTAEVLAWKAGPCGTFVCDNIWSGATSDEIVTSSPTVVNGQLYIGSADQSFPSDISGRLYVYGVRGTGAAKSRPSK